VAGRNGTAVDGENGGGWKKYTSSFLMGCPADELNIPAWLAVHKT
jgi:hypothetical protein